MLSLGRTLQKAQLNPVIYLFIYLLKGLEDLRVEARGEGSSYYFCLVRDRGGCSEPNSPQLSTGGLKALDEETTDLSTLFCSAEDIPSGGISPQEGHPSQDRHPSREGTPSGGTPLSKGTPPQEGDLSFRRGHHPLRTAPSLTRDPFPPSGGPASPHKRAQPPSAHLQPLAPSGRASASRRRRRLPSAPKVSAGGAGRV